MDARRFDQGGRMQELRELARHDPRAVALVDPEERHWSRGELLELVDGFADRLLDRGFARGDTLLVVSRNSAACLAAYLAGLSIGAYVVPVNWHLSIDEIVHIARTASARAIAIQPELIPVISKGLVRSNVAISIHLPLRESEPAALAGPAPVPPAAYCPGRLLYFTAATTGRPKAVLRPLQGARQAHARLLMLARQLLASSGVRNPEASTHLCQSSLYHGAHLETTIAALALGQRVVLMDAWRPLRALMLIERHQVTSTVMVPAMFVRLCRLPIEDRQRYSVASLRQVTHGAAPCPPDIKRQMIDWFGPVITELYGASEGGGTSITSTEWLARPGSVGRAHPGASIRVLREDGEEASPGEVGAIYIRPPSDETFWYLGDVDASRAAYRGDHFTVGDLGFLDADGFLTLCDRKVDVINCGGTKIFSAEIEATLAAHPAVMDCAAIGVPDALMGQRPILIVQRTDDAADAPALEAELLQLLSKRLPVFKRPARIEFVTEMPRDPNGKLFKRKLRAEFAA
jgi:long-chain acyl-CoA synthetase